jgi:pimeloyl-ACP methyl ester carboxylesterase
LPLPDFILFAQHGWADTHHQISGLARNLATPDTLVISPDLGWLNTWLRIEPLITKVEQIATEAIAQYPRTPIRIIGHSLGGLIWLEVLDRHRDWWLQVHSLVLVGSPVGGSDLGRKLDPFGWGIGIARDLGKPRRDMAEAIASKIPTLSLAGDIDGGSDGTVPIEATKFQHARLVCIQGLKHAVMKNHPAIATAVRNFWANPGEIPTIKDDLGAKIIRVLQAVPGITDSHPRDFAKSTVWMVCSDGTTVRTYKNPLQVNHVYVADREGKCIYSGYVGWFDSDHLQKALGELKQELTPQH